MAGFQGNFEVWVEDGFWSAHNDRDEAVRTANSLRAQGRTVTLWQYAYPRPRIIRPVGRHGR